MRPFILSSFAISIGVLAGVLAAQNDVKLAEPFATPSAKNTPNVIPRPATGQLKLPAGFTVEEYLDGIERPRYMALGPSKELLISDTRPNGIVWLVQGPGKEKKMLLEKLDRPYGIAFWKEYLYVAEATSIKRYKYDAKTMTPGPGEEVVPLKEFAKGPSTRSVVFDRKGAKMYISIAMEADAETGEDPRRAAINRYNPDGSGHEIFASGLRNAVGVHLYPGTDTPWVGVEERDALGDDLVPDIFTHIQQDGFYGWPYAYIGKHEDPRFKGMRPDLVAKTIAPDVILPAHVSMLDFAFYEGKQFPQQYRGGAFLAWHGSTNRSELQGYEVAFVPFTKGKPSGPPQHFLTGWMDSPQGHEVWGRPVALLEMPDGSLLVSDDGGKKIWRVSYNGK
jgi:glucose/arabinose dehydrogenase